MKLTRNPTTEANPDLRGRKHHFTVENAPAATLKAMDEMLKAAGWNNDGCPCYDDGFGCGWWIGLSEVDQFKADYKEAKAGVVAFMAAPAAAEAVVTTPVVTGKTVRIGQVIEDEQGRPFVVDQVMRMAGYTDARGYAEGTYFPVTYGFRSVRFDTCNANRIEYGVASTRLVRDIVVTPELIEAAHADALAHDAHLFACALQNATPEGWKVWGDAPGVQAAEQRRRALEAAHIDALNLNAEIDAKTGVVEDEEKILLRVQEWWLSHDAEWQAFNLTLLQGDALEINAEVDRRIAHSIERTNRHEFFELSEGQQTRIVNQCHNVALEMDALIARQAERDHHYTLTEAVEFRNRQALWESTWNLAYRTERLRVAHAEALQLNISRDNARSLSHD